MYSKYSFIDLKIYSIFPYNATKNTMNICTKCFKIDNQYIQCFKCNSKICLNCIDINSFSFCPLTLLYCFDCPFCYI